MVSSGRVGRRAALKFAAAAMVGAPKLVCAQSDHWVVGATFDNSGVEKPNGVGLFQGASACFNAINRAGGIQGRRIELLAADDQFKPDIAKANALRFAADPRVSAILQPQGTRQTAAIMDAVSQMAIVGPNTGTTALRRKPAPNVFWVRADYDREVERMIAYVRVQGLSRIALVYPNDPFGQAVHGAFMAAMARRAMEPAALATTPGTASLEVGEAASAMAQAAPQVVVMSLAGTVPAFVQAFRAAGGNALCYGTSVAGSAGNLKQLARFSLRPALSVVVPSPTARRYELVRRYQADMLASGFTDFSLLSIEGYVNAHVLAEGMRRSDARASRESVIAGLERITDFDLGGLRIGFSRTDREGSDFLDMVSVDADGRILS